MHLIQRQTCAFPIESAAPPRLTAHDQSSQFATENRRRTSRLVLALSFLSFFKKSLISRVSLHLQDLHRRQNGFSRLQLAFPSFHPFWFVEVGARQILGFRTTQDGQDVVFYSFVWRRLFLMDVWMSAAAVHAAP